MSANAALLFVIEPMFAKMALPLLGCIWHAPCRFQSVLPLRGGGDLWTDDFSNVLHALAWR